MRKQTDPPPGQQINVLMTDSAIIENTSRTLDVENEGTGTVERFLTREGYVTPESQLSSMENTDNKLASFRSVIYQKEIFLNSRY